jgi:hypothetical protein
MNRLFVFVGMLLLVSAPAWGTGQPCPTDRGACFIELSEGFGFSIFTEEEFLQFVIDDLNNDFIRVDPTEERFLHIAESDAEIMYCPFPWWQSEPDWDLCIVGRGHVSATGRPNDVFGLCPGEVRISGTGIRLSDGTAFRLSGRFLVTKNHGECVIRKVSIKHREIE